MAIAPLVSTPQQAYSEVDFSPLARLGDRLKQQRQDETLASLQNMVPSGAAPSVPVSPVPTGGRFNNATDLMSNRGGSNVQSWYDFARRPAAEGGLGLSHEQAAAKVANLQAESGPNIQSWGVTGDAGTAFGAAQWRQDRFNNLQRFAASRGMDFRSTEAQQAFMRHEYLGDPKEGYGGGSERSAYGAVTAARTPEQAASAINRYYERSADTTGQREANARRLAATLKPLSLLPY